jgi:class 3 adenylate cyclase
MGPMAVCAQCGTELPPDARFCPGCGAPVETEPRSPSQERKLATVLFADLVDSTRLGEQDPERTRALLDRFYDAMAGEIEDAGGTVEKFVGDAVMAAFGAPAAQEDHAERALHAAQSMHRRLDELFGDRLRLRIGVNTGNVVVGRARAGSSFVTGDAVNVAKRLEQAASPGEILTGERTVAAVRGAFEFDEPRTVEAKGKADRIACRRLVRALSLMRPRGVGGLRQVFLGRDRELELLQATYRRVVEQGQPHLVTIVGDAGVGKTRLARELWAWLAEQVPQPLQRTGRCLSYGQAITYWPLAEVLKEHLGVLDSDPPEAALARLGPRKILGLTLGLDVADELHPLAARDRLHEAWTAFLTELTGERPVVLLVEDLHWAEDELFDLLARLARDVAGPLFVLGTARPELLASRPAWGAGQRNASSVWLEPLTSGETGALVGELVAAELPERLRDLVVERADGNPFFVEELIRTLIEQGVLERRNGGWAARDAPGEFEIPDSVQAVVAARIDLLGPVEKAALQAASVIGRIFWSGPVRELAGEADFALLEERDFIRPRPASAIAGDREFAIKHALTREVAYGSLPKAKRARLHAQVASWIERAAGSGDEAAPLLAHHYAEAVRPEDADLAWASDAGELERLRGQAVTWLLRAAELALHRYEVGEALGLLERVRELEPDSGQAWQLIGLAHALRYDGERFWTSMQRALELTDDEVAQGAIYGDLALETRIRSGMWKRVPDSDAVEDWIENALRLSPPDSAPRAKALVARAYTSREPAAVDATEAGAIAERLGRADLRSWAFDTRSLAAYSEQQFDQALMWEQRRFDLADEISDPDHVADIYQSTVPVTIALGRFREGRRLAAQHDELAARLTPHHRVHGVAVLTEVEELAGDWSAVLGLRERIERAVEENLETPCVRNPRSLLTCAAAAEYLGEGEEAARLEARGLEHWMEGYGMRLNGPRIQLALARGDLAAVEELIGARIDFYRSWFFLPAMATLLDGLAALRHSQRIEAEAPAVLRRGAYLEPFALRALGVVRDDEKLLEQALERFEAMHLDWHAERTRELITRGN